MTRTLGTLVLAASLGGCFLLPRSDKKDEPSIDMEDSSIFITDDEPAELLVFVTHPKGPEAIQTAEIATISGQVIATLTNVREDRWIAEITWQDVQSVEDIEIDRPGGRMELEAFLDVTTKWDVTASQSISLSLACGNGGETCDPGVCADLANDPDNCGACGNACEACLQGQCMRQSRCENGGDEVSINGDDLCTQSGMIECQPVPFAGVDDAVFLIYDGAGCAGSPTPLTSRDGYLCDDIYGLNAGYSVTAMCVAD